MQKLFLEILPHHRQTHWAEGVLEVGAVVAIIKEAFDFNSLLSFDKLNDAA